MIHLNHYTIRIRKTQLVTYSPYNLLHTSTNIIRKNLDNWPALIYNIVATSIYHIRRLETTIGAFYKSKQEDIERREIR